MKKTLLLGAALAALVAATCASAADLATRLDAETPPSAPEVAPAYNWTWFYIGGNVGCIWGCQRDTLVDFTSDGYDLGPAFRSGSGSGLLGGIHGGYNWQATSQVVLGVEGDFDWTGLKHDDSGNLTAFGGSLFGTSLWGVSDRLNWLASARLRLGYAAGNWMPYATGGAAWSNTNYTGYVTNNIAASGGYGRYDETLTHTGWVAGAGVEYMATHNWLLRFEYLHYGFGGEQIVGATNPTFVPGAQGVFTLGSTSFDTVRVGVSYKFGG
jgi:outer membrane immunogenic protein